MTGRGKAAEPWARGYLPLSYRRRTMKYDVGKNSGITVEDAERGFMLHNMDEVAPEMAQTIKEQQEGKYGFQQQEERYYDQGLTDPDPDVQCYGGFAGRPKGCVR